MAGLPSSPSIEKTWGVVTLFLVVVVVGFYTFFGLGPQLKLPHFKYLQYNPNATGQLKHSLFSGLVKKRSGNDADGEQVIYGFTNFGDAVKQNGVDFWKSIKPGFTCPKELLTKVGHRNGSLDGHKWTCGLATLGKRSRNGNPCVVYSFGVQNDSYFEAEVLEKAGCAIYAYDPTVNKIGNPLRNKSEPRVHFQQLGIGGENRANLRTLMTLMQQNGHEWVDILKIDVEGNEYTSLNTAMKDFQNLFGNQSSSGLPVGQLLLEVHKQTVNRQQAEMIVDFLKRLESRGLRMFNLQINPLVPRCCSEFSFLNVNPRSLERFIGHIGDTPQP